MEWWPFSVVDVLITVLLASLCLASWALAKASAERERAALVVQLTRAPSTAEALDQETMDTKLAAHRMAVDDLLEAAETKRRRATAAESYVRSKEATPADDQVEIPFSGREAQVLAVTQRLRAEGKIQ